MEEITLDENNEKKLEIFIRHLEDLENLQVIQLYADALLEIQELRAHLNLHQ